jgi:hypothetical protein
MITPEPHLIAPEHQMLNPVETAHDAPDGSSAPFVFGESENLILQGLASKMRFVGLFIVGIGLFVFAYGVERMVEVGYIFAGLLDFVIGIWTFGSGTEFKKIAENPHKDPELLMRGLENLLRLYTLVYWLCLLAVLFTFIQVGAVSFGEKPA